MVFNADQLPALNIAVANFSANNTDPKAQLIATYATIFGSVRSHFIFANGCSILC